MVAERGTLVTLTGTVEIHPAHTMVGAEVAVVVDEEAVVDVEMAEAEVGASPTFRGDQTTESKSATFPLLEVGR